MGDTEEYFPRGGKKPAVTSFKQSGNFLGAPEKGERKKKKPKKKTEGDDGYLSDEASKQIDQSYKNCAVGLSYKTVKDGLVVLARVKQVLETKVQVMLPGRVTGNVAACYISEPYNKQLEAYVNDKIEKVQDLSIMFRPGQYVAVKVLEKLASDRDSLMLSMMPQHLNAGKNHADLVKGTIIQAAVSSVEDHGYVIDLGIPNTTAFLPKGNTNPDVELDIGSLTWCTIKSSTSSEGSCVVSLASDLPTLQKAFLKRSTKTPLLPGTAVDFTVDKALDNGIEGHILDKQTSYVQSNHADKVKGKKPTLGQKVRARVLYVMPTLKAPFLTMKNIFETTYPDMQAEQQFKEGDIVEEAQVIKIRSKSIHFKLGKGSIGSMSLKRVQIEDELTDEEVIAKSYPIGSTHKVRIMCYYLSDYIYSVSDEPGLLQERYFSLQDLQPGSEVTATIRTVTDGHLLVNVGRCIGIIPHAHMTDAGVFVDPKKATASKIAKKKFKEGQQVTARVLTVDNDKQSLALTLKPSLLSPPNPVPITYAEVDIGKAYTGAVKVIRPDYVLVSFFNNVLAYIPKYYIGKDIETSSAYHCGQIVNCTAIHVDVENKKFTASLTTQPFWPNKKIDKRKVQDDGTHPPAKKQKSNKPEKEKKDKKRLKSETDESDAIETDVHEDSDQILTRKDLKLIDLDTCTEVQELKNRISSLKKVIKTRMIKIKRIDEKIERIERRGLNKINKQIHTAMHTDKLVAEERIEKLKEAIVNAKTKIKELKAEKSKEQKVKNERSEKERKIEKEKKAKESKEEKQKLREKKSKEKQAKKQNKEDSDNESEDSEDDSEVEEKVKVKAKKAKLDLLKNIKVVDSLEPVLQVPSAKDFWNTDLDDVNKNVQEDSSSSSDEEEKEIPKKKRKKLTAAEKVAKAREEDEKIRELERRATENDSQPASCEQFERALLANPNCSQLWIAYMAFHLQATEMDKARAVGRKAINTISFREEQEKLNVWLAMINFENRFGHKDSQQKILEEALQMNEPFQVHSKLLDIYLESGKQQELSGLVDLMMKRYKKNPDTYVLCGTACYKAQLVDKARNVMQKALVVLEKKEHVRILVQFALLERSHGASERSEALFEQVLAVYPQRVDVVNVFVDMIVKTGDVERARQVLERMTSHKLPARKMKVLFRKWIEVEEKIGDPEQVEKIRSRAMEYVDKAKF